MDYWQIILTGIVAFITGTGLQYLLAAFKDKRVDDLTANEQANKLIREYIERLEVKQDRVDKYVELLEKDFFNSRQDVIIYKGKEVLWTEKEKLLIEKLKFLEEYSCAKTDCKLRDVCVDLGVDKLQVKNPPKTP